MTVPTEVKRKEYSGSGSAGPFTITFPILSETHLSVSKVVVATGVTTQLTLNAGSNGYTVNAGLTTITLTEVLASGEKLVILRSIPLKQEADYLANNPFPAEINEQGLDYLTMVAQQLDEKIDRAILLPETSSVTGVVVAELVDGEVLTYDSATKTIESSGYSVVDLATASTAAATATAQAVIATTQAGIATSAASTATTQASNASSSASAASASALQAASTFTATSTTSNTIGTGSKSFTTQTNKNFQAGQFMTITDSANNANYMFGRVTSYDNSTGALVFDSQSVGGSGTKTNWNISVSANAYSGATNALDQLYFGNGSDGDVTISSGVTTLTRNMLYNNLTISGTGQLNTNGFAFCVKNTLNLDNAPANAIVGATPSAPTAGGNGSLATGGTAGAGAAHTITTSQQVFGTLTGFAGRVGSVTTADRSQSNFTSGNGTYTCALGGSNNSFSGRGGDGSAGLGGENTGAFTRGTILTIRPQPVIPSTVNGMSLNIGPLISNGIGCGGTGDTVNGGGGGGGGSIANSPIIIFAKTVSRGASTAAGCIVATAGRAGANGGNATAGNCGGGGGGAGGSGSLIGIVYSSLTGSSKAGALVSNGSAGGNGGNGFGTGAGGYGGAGGDGGRIILFDIGTNTVTVTDGTLQSNGGANSGTTGGTGGAGGTCSAAL